MHEAQSAGGVVVNSQGQILVVNQNGDSWSLPKGHIDEGEDAEAAARREIAEESGITSLRLVQKLGVYRRYRIGKGGTGDDRSELKLITIFLFQTEQSDLKPTDAANPEARWVEINEVATLLTHPKDKIFFEKVLPNIQDFIAQNHLRTLQ